MCHEREVLGTSERAGPSSARLRRRNHTPVERATEPASTRFDEASSTPVSGRRPAASTTCGTERGHATPVRILRRSSPRSAGRFPEGQRMADGVASDDATRTLADPLAESLRIVEVADRQGLLVRLMGGMAIRAHAPDWPARTRRVEVDLDFATRSKDRGAFYQLLEAEGYTAGQAPQRPVRRQAGVLRGRPAQAAGRRARRQPRDVPPLRVRGSPEGVEPDPAARRAAALEAAGREDQPQGRPRRAGAAGRAPARERRRRTSTTRTGQGAINVPRILSFTSNDWGWWRTVTGNLDTLDKYLATELHARGPGSRQRAIDPVRSVQPGRRPAQGDRRGARSRPAGSSGRASASGRVGTTTPKRWDTTDARLLRHGHPRLRHLLAQVPQRRQVPQGRRPDHGRRHDRQGDGADRPGLERRGTSRSRSSAIHLASEDELAAMEKRISGRGYYPVRLTRDELDTWAGRPDAHGGALQGRDARLGRALDGPGRRADGGHRHPDHRLAGERRHVRDRSDHRARPSSWSWARRTRSSSTASRSSRPAGPTPRRGTRSASCPSPSCASGSTASWRRWPTRTARSSTSTRRPMARTLTMPRNSTPT